MYLSRKTPQSEELFCRGTSGTFPGRLSLSNTLGGPSVFLCSHSSVKYLVSIVNKESGGFPKESNTSNFGSLSGLGLGSVTPGLHTIANLQCKFWLMGIIKKSYEKISTPFVQFLTRLNPPCFDVYVLKKNVVKK
eukprot:TRINITY_DN15496_c0_g1_i1.p1 TRINITY_DN15496_c0_g1~~TRINITY_DN15496_c0_g1_i1.p1  ORF type:complete len:135 (-),score=2.46 TRINITY_DN15496_c0_g1_i1:65-469(-)